MSGVVVAGAARSPARLSLPREHGAYLTLVGAIACGAWVAPSIVPALGMGLALAASFCARGPADRLAARLELRAWDGAALAGLAGPAALGVGLAASSAGGVAWLVLAVVPLVTPAASFIARRRRAQRDLGVELAAMGWLGACAGLIAVAGGASPARAAALSVALGAHAGLAVPLLRVELRPAWAGARRGVAGAVAAALVVVAAALVALGAPLLVVALAPRALHAARLLAPGPREELRPRRAMAIGLHETGVLALVVAAIFLAS
jgi:hypothetical protein